MISGTLLQAQTAGQPPQKIKRIIVTGSAEMEVEPDEIFVNFELKEYYNRQKIKEGIEQIKKSFLEACAKAGISKDDIRVQGMGGSGYDYWYWRKNKRDPDFLATVNYIIKFSSVSKLDGLVPLLNDEGTSNMYISKISHSKLEDFRKQVKIQATQAAKQKAQYLAESIGEKTGPAIMIEEFGGSQPVMYNRMAMSNVAMETEGAGEESSTPFQKMKIRFEIRAEFELQ